MHPTMGVTFAVFRMQVFRVEAHLSWLAHLGGVIERTRFDDLKEKGHSGFI